MPVVRRSFPATSTLHGWIELLGAARDPGTGEPRRRRLRGALGGRA